MNRFIISFISVFVLVIASGCGSADTPETDSELLTQQQTNPSPSSYARVSLDWFGTYHGVTPCADCEGIDTTLELTRDESFVLTIQYLGKDDEPQTTEGDFFWNEAGNTVTLAGVENRPAQFFVAENAVIQLDMDGQRVTGDLADLYILRKQSESEGN
ncbi:NlpE N-terminal domain-containing protein [Cyclonatronum proteinivorum]|uniref:NlpE N-terminal domain-containing protein n=1 Tax=Cyclonatronum proteinivorum TaxID=1457365 RepID=A0A345UNM5_9BACT|nr:copper resistance protein NlpE [Cyclonatronum proteinivorum]AXJ02077.1 NlpE N-terminal domain-containing protein [Cyclonatronum proteinivorum]